jgi:hypothetical protein
VENENRKIILLGNEERVEALLKHLFIHGGKCDTSPPLYYKEGKGV